MMKLKMCVMWAGMSIRGLKIYTSDRCHVIILAEVIEAYIIPFHILLTASFECITIAVCCRYQKPHQGY